MFNVQLESELDRCHQLMSENLKKMVNEVREELNVLWEQCYVPEDMRTAFMVHFTGLYGKENVVTCLLKVGYMVPGLLKVGYVVPGLLKVG